MSLIKFIATGFMTHQRIHLTQDVLTLQWVHHTSDVLVQITHQNISANTRRHFDILDKLQLDWKHNRKFQSRWRRIILKNIVALNWRVHYINFSEAEQVISIKNVVFKLTNFVKLI